MPPMRCSYWSSTRHSWTELLEGCRHAEVLGFDGVWLPDHFMPLAQGYASSAMSGADPELGPLHEAWTALAGIAASVPRVRIGTLVTANTHRHPTLVAKMAATVDHISGGRCVLGMGAGWQENEHATYGLDFPAPRERFDRLDEACEMIRLLFDEERSDFEGRYYVLSGAPLEPKPLQARLPLVIGGTGRRSLAIAARHGDGWNGWGTPETLERLGRELNRQCEEIGRDHSTIGRSANAMVVLCETAAEADQARRETFARPTIVGTAGELAAAMAAYRAAGVDEFVAPDFHLHDAGERQALRTALVEVVASGGR